jgi:hypothetical protein
VAEAEGAYTGNESVPAQDLHDILEVILDGYKKLQRRGFFWDLSYNGKIYQNVEFVMFVPFIKGDTEEADRLCGHYTSRGINVAQICRYCHCPTKESDNPLAQYAYRSVPKIQRLVEKKDYDGLKNISQQYIKNAFYDIQFGTHNAEGIHTACPLEMLHALYLGIMKYVRDCLFEQLGPTSHSSREFNALAIEYGELLTRHSDRDFPKCKFRTGIQGGKLMAKEFPGILLCMICVLRSTKARTSFAWGGGNKARSNLGKNHFVEDWILLIETLLQWEMWLKSETMSKKHVERSKKNIVTLCSYQENQPKSQRHGPKDGEVPCNQPHCRRYFEIWGSNER